MKYQVWIKKQLMLETSNREIAKKYFDIAFKTYFSKAKLVEIEE